MEKVHGETFALAQTLLGWMDPGQMGHYFGYCGQFIQFFNLLKESGLTGL